MRDEQFATNLNGQPIAADQQRVRYCTDQIAPPKNPQHNPIGK
jgi:hypothetical protein